MDQMTDHPAALPANLPTAIDSDARQLAMRADELAALSTDVRINSREAFNVGADWLRSIKRTQDLLEEKRTSVTQPLNQVLRTINSWFAGPADKLITAGKSIRNAMGIYESAERRAEEESKQKAQAKRRAEEEELRLRAEKAQARGNTERAAALAAQAASLPAAVPEYVAPKAKGMAMGVEYEVELVDLAKLDRGYMVADMARIRAVVKAMKDPEAAMRHFKGAISVSARETVKAVRSR